MTAGRPKKYGMKDGMMTLGRQIIFLAEFEQARKNGKKYADAINSGVKAVKEQGFKMSEREAKRIFADVGLTRENKDGETLRCKIVTGRENRSSEPGFAEREPWHEHIKPGAQIKEWTLGIGEVPKFEKLKHKPLRQIFSNKFNKRG